MLPLQLLYDGPYAVLRRGGRSFMLRIGSREEIVAVSRRKACSAADATPSKRPGGSAAAKRVSFAQPLASTPSSTVPPLNGPRTVFLPSAEVFAHPGPAAPSPPPQQRSPLRQRTPPWNPPCQRTLPWYPQRQRTPPQRMDLRPPLLPAEARAREEPRGDRFGAPAPSYISTMAFVYVHCSETTLTGESRFHISTPLGI